MATKLSLGTAPRDALLLEPQNAHFLEVTYGDDVNESCLSRVLKADQRQLHLLFPEEALEPFDYPVKEGQHLRGSVFR